MYGKLRIHKLVFFILDFCPSGLVVDDAGLVSTSSDVDARPSRRTVIEATCLTGSNRKKFQIDTQQLLTGYKGTVGFEICQL